MMTTATVPVMVSRRKTRGLVERYELLFRAILLFYCFSRRVRTCTIMPLLLSVCTVRSLALSILSRPYVFRSLPIMLVLFPKAFAAIAPPPLETAGGLGIFTFHGSWLGGSLSSSPAVCNDFGFCDSVETMYSYLSECLCV
jgi:hypothetical protein